MITDEMLTTYATPVLLSGLMLYMAFIVYRMGKDSKAGKWGMFVLFLGLMVGVIGFVMKYVIKFFMEFSIG
jgi:hypothetical protein